MSIPSYVVSVVIIRYVHAGHGVREYDPVYTAYLCGLFHMTPTQLQV